MTTRIVTAFVLILIVVMGFLFPALAWLPVLLVLLLALAAVYEIDHMFRKNGVRPIRRVSTITVVLLIWLAWEGAMSFAHLLVGLAIPAAYLFRMFRRPIEGAWRDVAATLGAIAYIGVPLALVVELFVSGPHGQAWLLLMLTTVWATDTFALFVGKTFGRTKLVPRLSPGKTWEGSLGGLAGALLPALLAVAFFPLAFASTSDLELIAIVLVTSVLTQFGDLGESLLKRDAGVKDSGHVIPGHGGALDRMDSILFVAVPFSLYVHLFQPQIFATP